jgi:hypothetical protein
MSPPPSPIAIFGTFFLGFFSPSSFSRIFFSFSASISITGAPKTG